MQKTTILGQVLVPSHIGNIARKFQFFCFLSQVKFVQQNYVLYLSLKKK